MLKRISGFLRKGQEGFTLIELLVVVAIIALLATIALPRVYEAINTSKDKTAKGELATISGALERYYMEKGYYPITLQKLKDDGYLKSSVTMKNKFDKFYLYAVDDLSKDASNNQTKALHYVLVDPGKSPASAVELCSAASALGIAPTGLDPNAASGNKMLFWKTGSGASGVAGTGELQLALKGPGTDAAGKAVDCLALSSIPDSLSSWVPTRTDLVTE